MTDVCKAIAPIDSVALRVWEQVDAATLVAAWNDPEIGRWNPVPQDRSMAFADAWISGAAQQRSTDVGIDVVMERAEAVIGEIGLQVDRDRGIAEIGFWIGSDFRGQGLGKTMLELGIALGTQLQLQGLVAMVDPSNERTIGLLESAGWTELPTKSNRRAYGARLPNR